MRNSIHACETNKQTKQTKQTNQTKKQKNKKTKKKKQKNKLWSEGVLLPLKVPFKPWPNSLHLVVIIFLQAMEQFGYLMERFKWLPLVRPNIISSSDSDNDRKNLQLGQSLIHMTINSWLSLFLNDFKHGASSSAWTVAVILSLLEKVSMDILTKWVFILNLVSLWKNCLFLFGSTLACTHPSPLAQSCY